MAIERFHMPTGIILASNLNPQKYRLTLKCQPILFGKNILDIRKKWVYYIINDNHYQLDWKLNPAYKYFRGNSQDYFEMLGVYIWI
jgi:hypothetical protein